MVVPHLISLNKSWTGVYNSQLCESYSTHPISDLCSHTRTGVGMFHLLSSLKKGHYMEKTEKNEVTIEDLQKQIGEINTMVKTLQDENKSLKEQVAQKDLELTKLSIGSDTKKVTKEEKEDEETSFDFDF